MTKACAQCCQVKGCCSLVWKHPAAPTMPTKARKWPRVGEARSSKVGEVQEKEAEVVDKEGLWGKRVCEGITRLSGSLEGLTEMIRHQNVILGRLAGMMEEEATWAVWRRKRQGEPVVAPVIILGESDEEEVRAGVKEGGGEEEEVEEEARNEGEDKEGIE